MSPVKLIVIGILLYIGYLLIKGSVGKSKKNKQNGEINGPSKVSDVLVEDPVCKKLVPRQQAITAEHEGKTIYFCSKECCNTFAIAKGAEK